METAAIMIAARESEVNVGMVAIDMERRHP
jgi:hypothetical protein